ncbi:hypothetical protein [Sphingomonas sp. BK481]|jgi:hypothetical protein|uniref:hypothetical protein n=1 Tax=Sphingomonas sp. BK481 TaxID=2586981 RepID=UPI00161AB941|nr:hypothetical protein [Sphingomonas sp. BK481]MBB3589065.1 hypothetical protein [Sphingomonas sp. BK481]
MMDMVTNCRIAATPAEAGVQVGDANRLGEILRHVDLSNWTPAFAGEVIYE